LGPEQSQLLQRLRHKPFGILSEKSIKKKNPIHSAAQSF
jgi:hypothetical protein